MEHSPHERLQVLTRVSDGADRAGVPLSPLERIRMIREAASIMLEADRIADELCARERTAAFADREALLGQADEMWEVHSLASDLLAALIAGPDAISQMDAIQLHCEAMGG